MKFSFSKYVWFDGKFVPLSKAKVPITTHAIHYGTQSLRELEVTGAQKTCIFLD